MLSYSLMESINWKRVAGESIGTFLFAFILSVADLSPDYNGNVAHPYSLGGGAIILMMLAGFAHDPHLNPAITLGHFVRHVLYLEFSKEVVVEHGLIMLAQFLSAFPGAYLGWGLNTSMMYFEPTPEATKNQAFGAEFVYSSLIVAVALMIGKTKDSRILGSIVLGACYFAGVECASYYSGGCFNPALGLAINVVKYTQNRKHLDDTWIYIVSPMLGGLFGGLVNSILILGAKEYDREKTEDIILKEAYE